MSLVAHYKVGVKQAGHVTLYQCRPDGSPLPGAGTMLLRVTDPALLDAFESGGQYEVWLTGEGQVAGMGNQGVSV